MRRTLLWYAVCGLGFVIEVGLPAVATTWTFSMAWRLWEHPSALVFLVACIGLAFLTKQSLDGFLLDLEHDRRYRRPSP